MGHTVYPIRMIIYKKINELKKLTKCLRKKDRAIAQEILESVYQNISTIAYANPLPDEVENSMIFTMLLQEKKKNNNVSLDNLTLLIFSLMIKYKGRKVKNDESNLHRLLD